MYRMPRRGCLIHMYNYNHSNMLWMKHRATMQAGSQPHFYFTLGLLHILPSILTAGFAQSSREAVLTVTQAEGSTREWSPQMTRSAVPLA